MNKSILFAWLLALFALEPGCTKQAGNGGPAGAQSQVVEVVPVQRRDLVDSLNLVGSIAANESAEIRAEIAGQVREILFNEGERVERGRVLLKIDDSELRAQLAQAEARFKLAELNMQRAENLRQTQTNTQADFDRARAEYATSKAELSLLRVRLEKTEVKAPFAGVAGGRSVSPGDYVTSAAVIITIDDLSRLKIEFQAPERYFRKIHPGSTFTVTAKTLAINTPVQGEVYFVSSVIDRATRSSEIKGYLNNPPPELKPGMFVNVELVMEVRRGALTVPEGAILVTPAATQVIAAVEKNGEKVAEFIPVTLGLRARGLVEIIPLRGALAEQQEVVASGVGALVLFPGARLETRPLRAEFKTGE